MIDEEGLSWPPLVIARGCMRIAPLGFLIAVCAAPAVTGCGGGEERYSAQATSTPNVDLVITSADSETVQRAALQAKAERLRVSMAPREPPKYAVATSDEATLIVEDPYGRSIGAFDLRPVRGRGYAELKVILTARKIGEASPPERVPPSCPEELRCEYRLGKHYSVSLSEGSVLKMVPRTDGIALVARTLKLDQPTKVDVVFSTDGKVVSTKTIRLWTDYFELAHRQAS
jgi:hypothetical protein